MIEISRPYGDYKDTELFWLNKIPAHWGWAYLSQISVEKKEKNTGLIEKNVLSLSYGKIIKKKNIDFGLVPKEYSGYQIVNSGDIILRLTDLQNDKRSLRTGLVKERGIITSAYTCLKTSQNPNYIHYVLHAYDTKKVFYGMGGGVRQSIGYNEISKIRIPVPPRTEQDQIVKYLNIKLSKINKLIKAKRKQIELLKEQKQALINQAVTKGLDPYVKMKPSGIEWLGDIPETWGINKLGYLGGFQNGISESGSFFEKGSPFVSYTDVYRHIQLPLNVEGVANSNKQQQQVYSVKTGDIFFTRTSETIEEIGLTSVCLESIDNAIFSGFLIRFRPKVGQLDKHFSKYYFRNSKIREYFIREMNIVTRASLSQSLLRSMPVILPPLPEQITISRYLESKINKIDQIIDRTNQEIDLITEYRTSLISDVVTGKVDVRDIIIDDDIEQIEEPEFDISDEELSMKEEVAVGEEV